MSRPTERTEKLIAGNFSLAESHHDMLDRGRRATGKSKAKILREILDIVDDLSKQGNLIGLHRLLAMIEAIQQQDSRPETLDPAEQAG